LIGCSDLIFDSIESVCIEKVDAACLFHGVLHHAHQPHLSTVIGRVDSGDAPLSQVLDLVRQDCSPTPTKQENMAEACFFENPLGMGEHLHSSTLVGGDGNRMGILLDGCPCYLLGTPVMTKVDDLAALALQNSAEDSYRRIVPIED
jgi:hypothetical protein